MAAGSKSPQSIATPGLAMKERKKEALYRGRPAGRQWRGQPGSRMGDDDVDGGVGRSGIGVVVMVGGVVCEGKDGKEQSVEN